jgi:hypothetical protein
MTILDAIRTHGGARLVRAAETAHPSGPIGGIAAAGEDAS